MLDALVIHKGLIPPLVQCRSESLQVPRIAFSAKEG
jgi:hypothetical protein